MEKLGEGISGEGTHPQRRAKACERTWPCETGGV